MTFSRTSRRPSHLSALLCGLSAITALAGCDGDRTIATLERSFDATGVTSLALEHGAGDLEVYGVTDRDEVTIVARLKSFDGNWGDEDADQSDIDVDLELDGEYGHIVARVSDDLPSDYYVDVEVYVPAHVFFDLDDGSGDLVVEGVRTLKLADGSGDAVVERIEEHVAVLDASGDLVVRDVGGDVVVDDDSGDLVVEDVGGGVEVHDQSGDLVIRNTGDDVVIYDDSGDIVVMTAHDVDVRRDGSGEVVILRP